MSDVSTQASERALARSSLLILRMLTDADVKAFESGSRPPDLSNLDPLRKFVLKTIHQNIDQQLELLAESRLKKRADVRRLFVFCCILNSISILQSCHEQLWLLKNRTDTNDKKILAALSVIQQLSRYLHRIHWVRCHPNDTDLTILTPTKDLIEVAPGLGFTPSKSKSSYHTGGDRVALVQLLLLAKKRYQNCPVPNLFESLSVMVEEISTDEDDSDSRSLKTDSELDESVVAEDTESLERMRELVGRVNETIFQDGWFDPTYKSKYCGVVYEKVSS